MSEFGKFLYCGIEGVRLTKMQDLDLRTDRSNDGRTGGTHNTLYLKRGRAGGRETNGRMDG